jgi:hypothetical protein
LGGAALVASAIIGLQIAAVPRFGVGLRQSSLTIPLWGFAAIGLALLLRRKPKNNVLGAAGIIWMMLGLAAIAWTANA